MRTQDFPCSLLIIIHLFHFWESFCLLPCQTDNRFFIPSQPKNKLMDPQTENPNPVYKDERYGKYRELLYSYDENGNFDKTVTYHNEAERVVLQQAWDLFNERAEEARLKVLAGKASPVSYYMEKILADPMGLSMMAGIPIWKVKLHFKPYFFKKLSDQTLAKYAEAFNISVEQLKNPDFLKNNK